MNEFTGFPGNANYTRIPSLFFSAVLPEIADLAELKVILHIFWVVYGKKGYPRFVTFRELLSDTVLVGGLKNEGHASEILRRSLDRAVGRGILLHLTLERDGDTDDLYFLNTEAERRAAAKVESGEIKLGAPVKSQPLPVSQEQPNIFTLYEQNIGMLSPIIAEELMEAEGLYHASWIQDAFKEAVDLNKRSWRYIVRILERWAAEGKDDGKPWRDTETEPGPEEYYRRYGHLLKR
ncbi:MAG: DnaD domain protein [Dehalococcoidia bacterium]